MTIGHLPPRDIAWVLGNALHFFGSGAIVLVLGGLAALVLSMFWSKVRLRLVSTPPRGRGRRFGRQVMGGMTGGLLAALTYWIGAAIAVADAAIEAPGSAIMIPLITRWEIGLVLLGMVVGATVARYRWHGAGLLAYVGLLSMIVGYVAYALTVTIPAVPQQQRWLSYTLLAAEGGGLALIGVFSFYTIDASARRQWARRPESIPYDPNLLPTVAFEVPVFNEPPEMVEETVAHLVRQDYPRDRFCVVVADDSTDESIRRKNAEMCARLGAHHVTRTKRNGFKAGALNHVNRLLEKDVELVAIVDADYWVAPNYLRSIVGYFADPGLSFVQTPQDYRNVDESFLTRRYKQAEAYFYHGIMPSRNEENTIIFCGTMGIIRRKALEAVGGFAEDQICEDAEVSVRLAVDGWRSLYIDQSFGKGLMPAVFDSYKKQFYRWAFGNVRMMFTRLGTILRSRMTGRQKIDYIVSNLHWFDGFFVVGIAIILLYLGMGPVLGYDVVSHHQRELALLAIVPIVLMVDSMFRLHYVLKRHGGITVRETLLVQGMWFAIKLTNVRAVTKAMLGFRTPFIRTPKHPGKRLGIPRAFGRALRLTKLESGLGAMLLTVAVVNAQPSIWVGRGTFGFLLPMWLGLYALFFLTAPIYAYLSYRSLGVAQRRPVSQPSPAPRPTRAGRAHRSPTTGRFVAAPRPMQVAEAGGRTPDLPTVRVRAKPARVARPAEGPEPTPMPVPRVTVRAARPRPTPR